MLKNEQQIEYKNINLKDLFAQLQEFQKVSFSGSLYLKINNNQSWFFFFRLGHLSLLGGTNSVTALRRQLKLLASSLQKPQLQSVALAQNFQENYKLLINLLNQDVIERKQLADVIANVNTEILFDLIQLSQNGNHRLSYKVIPDDPKSKFISLLPLVEITSVLKQALQAWQKWQNQGLTNYSPNLIPVIKQPNLIQAQNLPEDQSFFIPLINGIHSLRDLAINSNIEIVTLVKSLLPLVKLEVIYFSSVPIAPKSNVADNQPNASSANKDILIACVDDSLVACQALEKIICDNGYRFVSTQNSLKALPLFLKSKPDFIFLDLMMPITNGYELCAQIRKTPSLKNVPVAILTGRDGLVDRMRAKLVGSTDFLSKPVEAEEVIKVLNRNLITIEQLT